MPDKCKLCDSTLDSAPLAKGGCVEYVCPNCGRFLFTDTLIEDFAHYFNDNEERKSILSHSIFKMQDRGEIPQISTYVVESILSLKTVLNAFEQAENLILWVGDHTVYPGKTCGVLKFDLRAKIGAVDFRGVEFILNSMIKKGYIDCENLINYNAMLTLTYNGWEQYHEIKKGIVESRKAFMAMPFGVKIIDDFFLNCLKGAVSDTGYHLEKLDDNPQAGLIDDRLKVEILTSKFVIVDLTNGNNGAYWEAGYAEGLNKPVIYTCEKSYFKEKKTHFDTNHYHTIPWSPSSYEESANKLKATIRATLPDEAKLED